MSNTRLFECENGKVYEFADKHCVFCKHCTDILYDYTNGPYCFLCELDKKFISGCDGFEDDGYEFNEDEYYRKMQTMLKYARICRNRMVIDPEFIKAYKEEMNKAWQTILFREPRGGEER